MVCVSVGLAIVQTMAVEMVHLIGVLAAALRLEANAGAGMCTCVLVCVGMCWCVLVCVYVRFPNTGTMLCI